jgi:hypothetical protein
MASTPKRRRLRATLARRAEAAIAPGATPLDYVERWVANGGLITELAASLQTEMGESMSRGFVSLIVHRLGPEATDRITAARRSGACALADGAGLVPLVG